MPIVYYSLTMARERAWTATDSDNVPSVDSDCTTQVSTPYYCLLLLLLG